MSAIVVLSCARTGCERSIQFDLADFGVLHVGFCLNLDDFTDLAGLDENEKGWGQDYAGDFGDRVMHCPEHRQ